MLGRRNVLYAPNTSLIKGVYCIQTTMQGDNNELCAWRHNTPPPPLQFHNIFAFIRQVAPVPACWLFRTSATTVDLWPFDLESGVWVTCDVGYLCTNFSLPRPLCSRLRPDVQHRQMSDKSIA